MQIDSTKLEGVLRQASQALATRFESKEAQLDAELLLSFSLDKSRTWLKTWPEYELSPKELGLFLGFVQRRLKGEPVAYILGFQEFWSLKLNVTLDTLVPRPETELLVELALEKTPLNSSFKVADLGTGTGAIALAFASERAQAQVFAVDFSEDALAVAKLNRDKYQLDSVQLIHNSWLSDWSYGKLDLILANPPYVAEGDPHLAELTYEPITALVAEDEGYSDIIQIAIQAKEHLNPGAFLMFEHGFEQAARVRKILTQLDYLDVESFKDLSGQDRVTIGRQVTS